MDSAAAASVAAAAAAAAADVSGRPRLYSDSLPLVDLRLLTQSELYSLSLSTSSSASSAHDDGVLIPKIDRSVFNESAGSRKQTFSRLRLAPRGTAAPASSLSRQKQPQTQPQPPTPPPPHAPLDEDNARIISLLQHLFAKDGLSIDAGAEAGFPHCSVPIEVVDLGPVKRKRGRPRKYKNADAAALRDNGGGGDEDEGAAAETNPNEDSGRLEDSMKGHAALKLKLAIGYFQWQSHHQSELCCFVLNVSIARPPLATSSMAAVAAAAAET
ncbi:hypothetical protein NL676_026136 [Syzygium grande]|nr:hypothetical protein NL676_026136 [Syzygium grande]